jgi:branched-chain amino acid transport system permease protein
LARRFLARRRRIVLDLSYFPQILVSGVAIGCIYGLIGIGFCVIYNASGIVNFAQGAFVMLGGTITHIALAKFGVPLIPAAIGAIAVVVVVGVVVERIVVRPLWDRNATMFVMILATLATQIVIERLTLLVAGDQPMTLPDFTDLPPLRLGGVTVSYQFLWIVGCSLFVIVLLGLFFKATKTGKAMRACAINREAAALQGIPVARMLSLSFALSAALGAIAGILITPTQYTAFNVGVPFAINGFIAAIVGGFGRPFGAFLGGIVLGLAQAIAIVVFGAGLKNAAALSILLIFLFLRPGGILRAQSG